MQKGLMPSYVGIIKNALKISGVKKCREYKKYYSTIFNSLNEIHLWIYEKQIFAKLLYLV